MSKRAFIIHGWDGTPEEGWFPWLKSQLEARGFDVQIPQLPNAPNPRIDSWVPKLTEVVGVPDEDTYFIGHSMGCQTIARYLESLPGNVVIGGAVFVAGFFKSLSGIREDSIASEIAAHWLEAPLNIEKVKRHLKKSVAIFSDDDPWVPLENVDVYRDELGSKIIIEKNSKHFSGENGFTELPVALDVLLEIAEIKS